MKKLLFATLMLASISGIAQTFVIQQDKTVHDTSFFAKDTPWYFVITTKNNPVVVAQARYRSKDVMIEVPANTSMKIKYNTFDQSREARIIENGRIYEIELRTK